jgi:hypothetical protein
MAQKERVREDDERRGDLSSFSRGFPDYSRGKKLSNSRPGTGTLQYFGDDDATQREAAGRLSSLLSLSAAGSTPAPALRFAFFFFDQL